MMLLFLIAVSFLVGGSANSVEDCPPGLSRDKYLRVFENKCYAFELFRKKTYQDALDSCKEDGGTLVLVQSKRVNNYVTKTMKYFNFGQQKNSKVWIGLHSEKGSKQFTWEDGSELDYNRFKDTAAVSDKPYRKCVELVSATGIWVEITCNAVRNQFICEYPMTNSISKETVHPTFPTNITQEACPIGFTDERVMLPFENTCYLFYTFWKFSYEDAQNFCKKNGGTLVNIKSDRVNEFLQHHLYVTHRIHSGSETAWIGLRYDKKTKGYKWADGSEPYFTKFTSKRFYRQCFGISPVNGNWKEANCGMGGNPDKAKKKYFICQFKPKPLPRR